MGVYSGKNIGTAADIDVIEIGLGPAPDGASCVNDCGATSHQLLQFGGIVKITLDELYAKTCQLAGLIRGSYQCAYFEAPVQQLGTQHCADKTGGAGNGNQAAAGDQADATLKRNSSVTAFRFSGSWELMKSRRALARDNLPEEVRGREWMGTSST